MLSIRTWLLRTFLSSSLVFWAWKSSWSRIMVSLRSSSLCSCSCASFCRIRFSTSRSSHAFWRSSSTDMGDSLGARGGVLRPGEGLSGSEMSLDLLPRWLWDLDCLSIATRCLWFSTSSSRIRFCPVSASLRRDVISLVRWDMSSSNLSPSSFIFFRMCCCSPFIFSTSSSNCTIFLSVCNLTRSIFSCSLCFRCRSISCCSRRRTFDSYCSLRRRVCSSFLADADSKASSSALALSSSSSCWMTFCSISLRLLSYSVLTACACCSFLVSWCISSSFIRMLTVSSLSSRSLTCFLRVYSLASLESWSCIPFGDFASLGASVLSSSRCSCSGSSWDAMMLG
mmetsp:Transcript_28726/g.46507  ORF Transcript_28726/g.46507 Transcript_28726/m.46507 type:complete len:340 (-) Transcript_28726:1572-2591(-)